MLTLLPLLLTELSLVDLTAASIGTPDLSAAIGQSEISNEFECRSEIQPVQYSSNPPAKCDNRDQNCSVADQL